MQSVDLNNYSIVNQYTGVPVTKAAINSPDVNAVYAHLETLANLAAMVYRGLATIRKYSAISQVFPVKTGPWAGRTTRHTRPAGAVE